MTGKVVDAEAAYRIGFASAVHPSDALWEGALEMARAIAGMDPKGLRLTLAHLDRIEDMGRDQALRWAQLASDWFGVKTDPDQLKQRILGK
jgi:enoyl-CoA hydratase/carnithine racemase